MVTKVVKHLYNVSFALQIAQSVYFYFKLDSQNRIYFIFATNFLSENMMKNEDVYKNYLDQERPKKLECEFTRKVVTLDEKRPK